MQGETALAVVDRAWRRGIRPEPPIPVSEWADRNRVLPPTSAEPGRWRTSTIPAVAKSLPSASAVASAQLISPARDRRRRRNRSGCAFSDRPVL